MDSLDEYTFSATAPNRSPEVSYLEFPTPACPLVVPGVRPIVTRQFQTERATSIKQEERRGRDSGTQVTFIPPDSGSPPRSGTPVRPVPTEQYRTPARSSSILSRPGTPLVPHPTQSPTSPAPSATSMASPPPRTPSVTPGPSRKSSPVAPRRSALRQSSASMFPPENFEDYLPPRRNAGVVTRSASRSMAQASRPSSPNDPELVSAASSSAGTVCHPSRVQGHYKRNTRKCPFTIREREARAKSLAKGKGGESLYQHYTCWFESGGRDSEPLVYPPDLTGQDDLELGDIFCHYFGRGKTQLWLWSKADDGSLVWLPIVPGHRREEDGRVISLTDKLRPSWIQDYWFGRNKVPNARGGQQFRPY